MFSTNQQENEYKCDPIFFPGHFYLAAFLKGGVLIDTMNYNPSHCMSLTCFQQINKKVNTNVT